MWQKLLNIEKTQNCPTIPHKITNNRHKYEIQVQDRIFKIKKNPLYIPTKKEQLILDERRRQLSGDADAIDNEQANNDDKSNEALVAAA